MKKLERYEIASHIWENCRLRKMGREDQQEA
jgi:hypothetical protein